MQRVFWGMALSALIAGSAHAALLSRAGGQAYYDDVLNITWLADANYARTSGYDSDGKMDWSTAQAWIASLNGASHLGVSDWRLSTVTDTGTPGCNSAYTGTDCGWNVDLTTGEMAHLNYSTLGNVGYYDIFGVGPQPGWGPPNQGPFSNVQANVYWSGTVYAPFSGYAWTFNFYLGNQNANDKTTAYYAWAVRPGDIVPVPTAMWLFGSALGVTGLLRRRVRARA